MSNKIKVWLIVGATLVFVGGVIFGGAMMGFKWDFSKLSTVKYQTNECEITESFKDISVVTDTADIEFLPSENSGVKVVCYQKETETHSVTVNDGTLTIELANNKKWYQYIGISFETPKITVYLPEGEYGALSIKGHTGDTRISQDFKFKSIDIEQTTGHIDNCADAIENIKIKTNTGDVNLQNHSAFSLDIFVSTGKVSVSNVNCEEDVKIIVSTGKTFASGINCKSFISSGGTGDISLKDVVSSDKFSIHRSTGDVKLEDSDAATIFIKTSTGRVSGTLLTDKVFITESDTGKINVPKTTSGGKCEIITNTGDIKISVS